MEITKEPIRSEQSKDIHWSRIHFANEDGTKQTRILICASDEYLLDLFETQELNEENLNEWYESVVTKWNAKGEKIFENELYFDAYANSAKGKANDLHFLQTKIKP